MSHARPLFPVQNPRLFEYYNKAMLSFWTVNEVDLERDDAQSLPAGERNMLKNVLAFFACSDVIVNDNIMLNFWRECVFPEAQMFYGMQMAMETVHTVVYNLIIDKLFRGDEKQELFEGVRFSPRIADKAEFCNTYMADDLPLGERLVAYACVEGIFFCSSFAAIYFFKKKGLLPGVTFSNELISRDESLHAQFSCALYQDLVRGGMIDAVPVERIREIVARSVELESLFVDDMLSDPVLGFSAQSMREYVRCMGNMMMNLLGEEKLFNASQPFEFMDLISLVGKTNFFESRVSEYSKVRSERVFVMDADF